MKYIKKLLLIIMLILIAVVLRISIKEDIDPGKAFSENVQGQEGTWSVEHKNGKLEAAYRYNIPAGDGNDWVLQLQSHWSAYDIAVDGENIYHTDSDRKGAVHLFKIPMGKNLVIRFRNVDEHSKNAVMQSKMYLGDRENVYASIHPQKKPVCSDFYDIVRDRRCDKSVCGHLYEKGVDEGYL